LSGESTSIVRDPAGAREPTNATAGNAVTAAVAPLRETFAALDAGASPGTPTWTHASARQAEAGFEDPALGWIGVRADRNGDGVHVALVPGSAEAAQELGTHMDGLNTYLAEQHTRVESLAMAAPEGRGANHGTEQGAGQGLNQGMSQGTGQNGQQQAYSEPESNPELRIPGVNKQVAAEPSVQAAGPDESASVQRGEGVHISVMA
jgi:hypothetical protein